MKGIGKKEGKYVICNEYRFFISDKPIQAGDQYGRMMKIPFFGEVVVLSECESLSADGTKLIRSCTCGECSIEDRFVDINECIRLVSAPVEAN